MHFHIYTNRFVISIVVLVACTFTLLSVSTPALASSVNPAVPTTDGDDNQPESISEDLMPAPPISKAFMGAPVAAYDADGDVRFASATEKWIDVDLSEQKVIAFEGVRPVRSFIISSGLPRTPTVTGTFRIRAKVRSQTMSGGSVAVGDYYYLPNVEWVQYFYQGYAFHGAYWHNKFGQPMSHGCINMRNEDAEWLFNWAGPEWNGTTWMHVGSDEGTLVHVHE